MIKTLRISFSLRNTYRVNGILYAIKQIPLLKKVLPNTLYQMQGLKIFANILSALWEMIAVFLGKGLYFFLWCLHGCYIFSPHGLASCPAHFFPVHRAKTAEKRHDLRCVFNDLQNNTAIRQHYRK